MCYVGMEHPNILWITLELLVELRYLEMSSSNLRTLPRDIGNLTKLQMLKLMYEDELTVLPLLPLLLFLTHTCNHYTVSYISINPNNYGFCI